jgi:Ca2+-binding RTX toxin-like protein
LVGGASVDPYCSDCNTSTGGPGDDYLDAYGRKYDAVSYEDRVDRVVVSLREGEGGDPAIGEHDSILGARGVMGGAGNDAITGDGQANELYGLGGQDLIRGLGSRSSSTAATATTSSGGGPGRDYIRGHGGNDELWSFDGVRDRVFGDSGTDRAHRDYGLDVVSSVERFF